MNISIKNLNKIYPDGHQALNNLNLDIEPGMFGLLGPNGAGKTSLMRIMTLLQNASSGTILFDDYRHHARSQGNPVYFRLSATGFPFFRKTENLGIFRLRRRACPELREPGKDPRSWTKCCGKSDYLKCVTAGRTVYPAV